VTEPIGLSTSWNGPGPNAERLIDEHRSLGFRRLEAYQHFNPEGLRALAEEARRREVEIGSLHAPCPIAVPVGDGLASTHSDERQRSVDAHKRTVDAAAEYGARAIVVHLGNTGVMSRQRALFETIARSGRLSEEHLKLRHTAWQEREASKRPHLDAALESIRAIGQHALGTGVKVGVECRDNYIEIPSLDEYAEVLGACDGLPVGYWHDAGHGAKLEYLGFLEHEDFLRRWGDRIVGMHIHDTLDGRDHQAPGQGTTDFAMLARYLKPDTIRTMELHRTATATQITQALDILEPLGVYGVAEGILVSS
jgi:sugar phosphate isomerase/epimerase